MRRLLLAGAAALGLMMSLGASAQAPREVTFLRTPAWHVYATTGSQGRLLCSATTRDAQRTLYIKYGVGSPAIEFQIIRQSWALREGRVVRVRMWVDRSDGWIADARVSPGTTNMLFWFAYARESDEFERAFRNGVRLYIAFPDNLSDEPEPWVVHLGGSGEVIAAFIRCMALVNDVARDGSVRPPAAPAPQNAPSLFGTSGRRT